MLVVPFPRHIAIAECRRARPVLQHHRVATVLGAREAAGAAHNRAGIRLLGHLLLAALLQSASERAQRLATHVHGHHGGGYDDEATNGQHNGQTQLNAVWRRGTIAGRRRVYGRGVGGGWIAWRREWLVRVHLMVTSAVVMISIMTVRVVVIGIITIDTSAGGRIRSVFRIDNGTILARGTTCADFGRRRFTVAI